jgi:hypothetical protein
VRIFSRPSYLRKENCLLFEIHFFSAIGVCVCVLGWNQTQDVTFCLNASILRYAFLQYEVLTYILWINFVVLFCVGAVQGMNPGTQALDDCLIPELRH